jgi:hypothetical protein
MPRSGPKGTAFKDGGAPHEHAGKNLVRGGIFSALGTAASAVIHLGGRDLIADRDAA